MMLYRRAMEWKFLNNVDDLLREFRDNQTWHLSASTKAEVEEGQGDDVELEVFDVLEMLMMKSMYWSWRVKLTWCCLTMWGC